MTILSFKIPTNLDGEQLRIELGAELVYIKDDLLYVVGDISEATVKAGIAAHVPAPIVPLTADEAKLLLL